MIRLCMALAAMALTGCTTWDAPGTPAFAAGASGAKATCDDAAFNKRAGALETELGSAYDSLLSYKGDISEWAGDKFRYKRDYCALSNNVLRMKKNILQNQKEYKHCMNRVNQTILNNHIREDDRDTAEYQRKCGLHNL